MAWYAELKRRKWYCINAFHAIRWYSKYLYNNWYNSLTDEEKHQLEVRKQKRREREEKELQDSFMRLAMITGACLGLNMRSNAKKYHGVFDENGFPQI